MIQKTMTPHSIMEAARNAEFSKVIAVIASVETKSHVPRNVIKRYFLPRIGSLYITTLFPAFYFLGYIYPMVKKFKLANGLRVVFVPQAGPTATEMVLVEAVS